MEVGYSPFDTEERFLVMRFQCPLLVKGNTKIAEITAVHRVVRILRELLYQIINRYDSGHISDMFVNLNMCEMDTASFLYLFHENASSLKVEYITPPSLSNLCVNHIRGYKREDLHILPMKCFGMPNYSFYSVSYDNYMLQQAFPHIQFCSHPVPYFNYFYDTPFCLILDLELFRGFQRILRSEQRRHQTPDVTIDIGMNEVVILDHVDGLQPAYCFLSFNDYSSLLMTKSPFDT